MSTSLLIAPAPDLSPALTNRGGLGALPSFEILSSLEAMLVEHWIGGTCPTYTVVIADVLASRVADGDTSRTEAQMRGHLGHVWSRLETAERFRGQVHKPDGPASLGGRSGLAVHWLNLSDVRVQDATLATVIASFLTAEEADVSRAEKGRLRTAMRLLLDLPTLCPDTTILAAAAGVSMDHVIDLPERLVTKASKAQDPQSAKNLRTALRAAMRYAATRRRCPIVFPPVLVPTDSWVAAMARWFPLNQHGATHGRVLEARQGLTTLALLARERHGDTCTFEELDRARADQLVDDLRRKHGKCLRARTVTHTLNCLAELGVGPYAEATSVDEFLVRTPGGLRPAIYLRDGSGRAHARDWDGMVGIARAAGLPRATVDLLTWYGQWVTLPPEALLVPQCPWPPLLTKHRLSSGSLGKRSVDLRAWMGCALHLCGLRPDELTPEVLFGSAVDQIARTLIKWWLARKQALEAMGRKYGTATKGGLHHIVVSAGLLAYAGYAQEQHRRRQSVSSTRQPERPETQRTSTEAIDLLTALRTCNDGSERQLLEGYQTSVSLANSVKALAGAVGAKGKQGVGTKRAVLAPEIRDIRAIMKHTPPQWWIQLLEGLHERIRFQVSKGMDDGFEFYRLVQDAWEIGLFVSTGLRGDEACTLELGVHVHASGGRKVSLAAAERKNVKPQTAIIQERFVPHDIHTLYIERTRWWFLREQHEELAARREAAAAAARTSTQRAKLLQQATAARGRVQTHAFLIVNTEGTPPGGRTGEGRITLVGAHGTRWRNAVVRRAVEVGLTLPPTLDYMLGRHAVRGAFAYALFQAVGPVAAANYLGDCVATVELAYAAVEGAFADPSAVANFAIPDRGITRESPSIGTTPSASPVLQLPVPPARAEDGELLYLQQIEALRKDRRDGIITQQLFDTMVAAYGRQHAAAMPSHVQRTG